MHLPNACSIARGRGGGGQGGAASSKASVLFELRCGAREVVAAAPPNAPPPATLLTPPVLMRDASGDRVAGGWREEFADIAGAAAQALSCERQFVVKRSPRAEKSA